MKGTSFVDSTSAGVLESLVWLLAKAPRFGNRCLHLRGIGDIVAGKYRYCLVEGYTEEKGRDSVL